MPQRHRLHCFGIKRYYRYRDDVLMVCSKKQGTREFFPDVAKKRSSQSDSKPRRCVAAALPGQADNVSCKTLGSASARRKSVHVGQLEWSSAMSRCAVARLMSHLAKKSSSPAFWPIALPTLPSHVFQGPIRGQRGVLGFHPGLQRDLEHPSISSNSRDEILVNS